MVTSVLGAEKNNNLQLGFIWAQIIKSGYSGSGVKFFDCFSCSNEAKFCESTSSFIMIIDADEDVEARRSI